MTVIAQQDTARLSDGMVGADALAARLDVSERTIQRLAKKGKIPHYRVGSQLRFDICEALAALRVTAA